MVQKAIHTETIADGLDRQNLTQLKKRFLAINSKRAERTRSALGERQQLFLDVLPLLLHVNHPMLPGYVSHSVPCGIAEYSPGRLELLAARTLARSFRPQHNPVIHTAIEGLYLMGSVGTVAHSDQSDLDVWVCHKPGLESDRLAALVHKCQRISEWAASLRLEVHFFPMDFDAFKQGQISPLNAESSGSAQRLLLLDEFYRTALHLAGRVPLWWFVPPAAEADYGDYSHRLLHRRYLHQHAVLDFGGVAEIPAEEFLGAGIWQLYKAIESPYKSVLKLLLLEAYVGQHPLIEPLSLTYKRRVYEGTLEVDELDPYIMIYRCIEQYLRSRQQLQRLELARRCLYFKIGKPLSMPPTGKTKSWQRRLLERLTAEWGWDKAALQRLDQRANWKAHQVLEERTLLVTELTNSYRFLNDFAVATGSARAISTRELTVLGRKLHAIFERRPGKIEWINPGISDDLSESLLVLKQSRTDSGSLWTVAAPPPGVTLAAAASPLKQCASLVESLLWCLFNGLVHKGTRFELSDATIGDELLHRLLQSLQRWMQDKSKARSHHLFETAAAPTDVLLLLNVNAEPQAHLREQGMQRMSNRMDALRYSGFDDNLVVSVDSVSRNSWQEISCTRYEGTQALLAALEDYLNLCVPSSGHRPPLLSIHCVGASHTAVINQRVREWFSDITQCFYGKKRTPGSAAANARYVFALGNRYVSLRFVGARLLMETHRSEAALVRWLGREQSQYSSMVVDKRVATRHPLRLIAQHSLALAVNVFYHQTKRGLQVYVVDECGSLLEFSTSGHGGFQLIALQRFLNSTLARQARSSSSPAPMPVQFFEFCKNSEHELLCQRRLIPTSTQPGLLIDLKATLTGDGAGRYHYNFYCDQQEFSYLEYGDRLFQATAAHVVSQRQSGEGYPIYLSDLDLESCRSDVAAEGQLQTSHYLRLKLEMEQSLNQALDLAGTSMGPLSSSSD